MERSSVKDNILEHEVLHVIAEQYDMLFSAEKKVADYVLANPQETVDSNVSEIARISGVSDATIVRMCRHLGYEGYYQFRITLSRDLGRQQQMKDILASGENMVEQMFGKCAEHVLAVGKRIEEETMRTCVELLERANTVHIIAVGNACNLSQYMGFRMERMGIRCIYDNIPEYYINHINLSNQDDLVIAISKSGSSKAVIRGMELAKERGLKLIAVTASTQSPVSSLADHVLISSGKQEPFSLKKSYAYLNEFVVIEVLLNFIMNKDKANGIDSDKSEFVLSDNKI